MSSPLIDLFAEALNLPATALNDNTSPDNTPEWDSLASMTLVTMLEESFNVELSTSEIMKMRSIRIVREVLAAHGITGI